MDETCYALPSPRLRRSASDQATQSLGRRSVSYERFTMTPVVHCPYCHQGVSYHPAQCGSTVSCPHCGRPFQIAHTQPAVLPSLPSEPTTAGLDFQEPDTHRKPRRSRRTEGQRGSGLLIVGVVVLGALGAGGFFILRPQPGPAQKTEQSGQQDKGNPELFKQLYRVAKEIKGAQETGVNRIEFGKLLNKFATELGVAKDAARTDKEREVIRVYGEALDILKDSAVLWDAKNNAPVLQGDVQRYSDTFAMGEGDKVIRYLNYQTLLIMGRLPVQLYSTGNENELAGLAKRYSLAVSEDNGWRHISADSFQVLWQKASEKLERANKLSQEAR